MRVTGAENPSEHMCSFASCACQAGVWSLPVCAVVSSFHSLSLTHVPNWQLKARQPLLVCREVLGERLSQPTTHTLQQQLPSVLVFALIISTRLETHIFPLFWKKIRCRCQSRHHTLWCVTPLCLSLCFCRSSMPPLPSVITLTTTAAPPSSFWGLWWCHPSWSWQQPSSASYFVGFGSFSSFSPSSERGTTAHCWTGRAGSTPGSEWPGECRGGGWANFGPSDGLWTSNQAEMGGRQLNSNQQWCLFS